MPASQADGHAEREAALALIEPRADRPGRITLGADLRPLRLPPSRLLGDGLDFPLQARSRLSRCPDATMSRQSRATVNPQSRGAALCS